MAERRLAVKLMMSGPSARSALGIIDRLHGVGAIAYIAGGAVRDLLLGREPKDYDVACDLVPERVGALFRKKQMVGAAFGVVLVRDFGHPVEVATFRADGNYVDGRRPEAVRFTDAAEDAQRRDFGINGLFYDTTRHEVIDFVDGLKDLNDKKIRAIGQAKDRFQEDHLRLLRAIRFSLRMEFGIEASTWEAMQFMAGSISVIAPERVHNEMELILDMGQCDRALKLLEESRILKHLIPGLGDRMICFAHEKWQEGGGFVSALALLRAQVPADLPAHELFLGSFRCTNQQKREILGLLKKRSSLSRYQKLGLAEKKRLLRDASVSSLLYFWSRFTDDRETCEAISRDMESFESSLHPVLPITGHDLLRAGVKGGGHLGDMLEALETLALEGEALDAPQALERLRQRPEFSQYFAN